MDGKTEVQFPAEADFSLPYHVETIPGTQADFYSMCTRHSFPGYKATGA
jgi:hypothetical protein